LSAPCQLARRDARGDGFRISLEIRYGRVYEPHGLVRYRARAHVCNRCPSKPRCTDSDRGREVVRALDPWPHSEAGRLHRAIALLLVALSGLILLVELVRHHDPVGLALLIAALGVVALGGHRLVRDVRKHPANFPVPAGTHYGQLRAPTIEAHVRKG
jgi:hypothetical protein